MKRILLAALALGLMAPVANAQYIDCASGSGCREDIYGMTNAPGNFGWDLPNTRVRVTSALAGTGGRVACGTEGGDTQNFEPITFPGQMVLREQIDCVVSEGARCQVEIPDRDLESGDFNVSKIIIRLGPLGLIAAHGSLMTSYQGSVGFRQLNGRCVDGNGDTVLTQCTTDADCDQAIREECDTDTGTCIWWRQAEDPTLPDFDPLKVGGTRTDAITKCWNDGQCGGGESCQGTCVNSGTNCQSDTDCGAGDSCSSRVTFDGIGKCIATADLDAGLLPGNGTGLCITDPDPENPAQACAAGETCLDAFLIFQFGCSCCVSDTGVLCPNLVGIPDDSIPNCPRASPQPFRRGGPDLLFAGGAGTRMGHETFIPRGQQEGNCHGNRKRGCGFLGDEGQGAAEGKCTIGNECTLGDPANPPLPSPCDDVAFGGIEGDRCDYGMNGYIDFAFPFVLPDGTPNPIQCKGNPVTIRGDAGAMCGIPTDTGNTEFTAPGCQLINTGVEALPDFDCNGVDDREEGRCQPDGLTACTTDADCGGLLGSCITGGDPCPFVSENQENWFRDSNGDGIGDECQCGDFGDRSTIPVQNDGFVTSIDIAGAAQCANAVFAPDPVLGTIQQCDPAFLDTDADFSITSLDIAGIVSVVNGALSTSDVSCLANLPPQPIP